MERLVLPAGRGGRLLLREVVALDPRERLSEPLDLRVAKGRIAELAPAGTLAAQEGEEVFEGEGRIHLFPAFFDPHVHLRVPGEEHKEDLASGTRAAAAGGFWGVIGMANTQPPIDDGAIVRSLREQAREQAVVAVGFLGAISRGLEGVQLTEMVDLREQGVVGFSDDGRPLCDAALLRNALRYQRLCGGVVALHEEDPRLAGGGVMREGPLSARLGLTGIPAASESTMVARDLQLAELEQARLHLLHLSCARSVELLAEAKERGVCASGEVTPHHLLLEEGELERLDTNFKVNPPLGDGRDRAALLEGLRSGTIDCIATDHAPHAPEDKELPLERAAMGTTGLETAFAALYTGLVAPGLLDLATVVHRLTEGAAVYGLEPARVAKGQPANLTAVDLQARWVAGEQGWHSRSANCCFAGRVLQGRVVLTLCDGLAAHRLAGEVVG